MLILGKSPIGITYIQIISARKKLCHTFLSLSKSYYHYDLLQKIKIPAGHFPAGILCMDIESYKNVLTGLRHDHGRNLHRHPLHGFRPVIPGHCLGSEADREIAGTGGNPAISV